MAASEENQSKFKDVEFTRTTSTKNWTKPLDPEHYPKTKQEPLLSYTPMGGTPRVVRTGGVTGTLPSQSLLPDPGSSSGSSSAAAPPPLQQAPPPPPSQQTLLPAPSPTNPPRLTKKRQGEKKPLPSSDVLDALFDRLTKRMKLPSERVSELYTRTPEQKWSMILAQNEIQAGIASVFYIEQLVRHTKPELKEKRLRKRLLLNLQPLSTVLTDLEVDLRVNPNDSWVNDFISTPNHGHVAIIDLIKDLADTPQSLARKNVRKYSVLERDPSCLHTALLCLKALMGHKKGFGAVLKYDPSLCVLAYCLDNQNVKIKILILKMMVTVLLAPGGHRKVMQAFDYLRAIMKERTRFQLLMSSLTHEPVDPSYQAAVLCFVNTVVQVAKGPNAKVFHQQEFLEARFSPEEVEKSLHGRQDERILHELKEWRGSFINVQSFMDNLVVCRGRLSNMEEELKSTQKYLNEANSDREGLYGQAKAWIEKTEKQRQRILELSESVNQLLEVKRERDGLLEEKKQLVEAKESYHTRASELKERVQTLMDENKALLSREVGVQEQVDSLNKYQTMLLVSSEPESPSSPSSTIPPVTPPPAPPPPPLVEEPFIPPQLHHHHQY